MAIAINATQMSDCNTPKIDGNEQFAVGMWANSLSARLVFEWATLQVDF